MLALAWIIFGVGVVSILIVSLAIIAYYSRKDPIMVNTSSSASSSSRRRRGEDDDSGAEEEEEGRSSSFVPRLVSTMCITLVLSCTVLIPIDIYTVSSSVDHNTGARLITNEEMAFRSEIVRVMYYVLYLAQLLMAVFWIPFAHFYFEETGSNACKRAAGAFKFAAFFIIILLALLVMGIFLGSDPTLLYNTTDTDTSATKMPFDDNFPVYETSFSDFQFAEALRRGWEDVGSTGMQPLPTPTPTPLSVPSPTPNPVPTPTVLVVDSGQAQAYIQSLFTSTNVAEHTISFAVAAFTLLGFTVFATYTAYGLSSLPISLLKGKKQIDEEQYEVQVQMEQVKEKRGDLGAGRRKGDKMNLDDLETLTRLEDEERMLSRQQKALDEARQGCSRFCIMLRPFFALFGGLCGMVSFVLIASVILSTIDRTRSIFVDNVCGKSCAFIDLGDDFAYYNPLDLILTFSAAYFPLDVIVLSLIIAYFVVVTISAITSAGVRLGPMKLYTVAAGRTSPQALLWFALLLVLAVMALNFELMLLAPQYATWGSQTYMMNGEIYRCDLTGGAYGQGKEGSDGRSSSMDSNQLPFSDHSINIRQDTDAPQSLGNCTMTQLASMFNVLQMRIPVFGYAFTLANCIFVLAWVLGLLVACCKSQESYADTEDDDDMESFYGDEDL